MKKRTIISLYVAFRIMVLKEAFDNRLEDMNAKLILAPGEIAVLEILMKDVENKSPKSKIARNPFKYGSIPWCTWIIARKGGWSGYKSAHGSPGYETIKSGLIKFWTMVELYKLINLKY